MTAPLLMLIGLTVEATFSWPLWLYRRIRHPVVWIGALIAFLETRLNSEHRSHRNRRLLGAMTLFFVVTAAIAVATLISEGLPNNTWGYAVEAAIASTMLASRSLYAHVAAVARPLEDGATEQARDAIGHIVGRDASRLDSNGIARASLESLAENTSDGIVAPLFWGALLGLPGITAYKAINTLDSMLGHRSPRYEAFGWASARTDDLVNLLPARITAALFILASGSRRAIRTVYRDAGLHRSPNAGWPESAMAGSIGVRLSGPRHYGRGVSNEPWINGNAPDPTAESIRDGLRLYVIAMIILAAVLALIAALLAWS